MTLGHCDIVSALSTSAILITYGGWTDLTLLLIIGTNIHFDSCMRHEIDWLAEIYSHGEVIPISI